MDRTTEGAPGRGRITLRRDLIWPVAIAVALALVMAVNAVFIYVAVTGSDPVAPSYNTGDR